MRGSAGHSRLRYQRFNRIWMQVKCLVTACSVGLLAACTGPPSEHPAESSETASVAPAASTPGPSAEPHATVSFPGASGLEASVTNEPQTPEM